MKIELKNIKHSKFASRETECFEATVYVDGVKQGTVTNDGNGGSNMYYPSAFAKQINDYAKTLPPTDISHLYNDGNVHTLEQDVDLLINNILQDHLEEKSLKNKVMFRIPGEKYGHGMYHVLNKTKYSPEVKTSLEKKYGADVFILNEKYAEKQSNTTTKKIKP